MPAHRESDVDRKKRIRRILTKLRKTYGDAECALIHDDPFQLLCATILSAQCTDERVNQVTPQLFQRYPDALALAQASLPDLESVIQSTGFFRSKAKNLKAMAVAVVERHGGEIPANLEALTQLAGVGRKTANVVLGTWFGISSGVVVDTHVKRISMLLGLTTKTDPVQIERDLMDLLPKKEWINFSHRLIHHGRRICIARRPQCPKCPLLKDCPRVGLPPLKTV
ncbi:MAG: endonuclease III [Planctomycetaceae bacterium]|nr:endonuclease III [Planctomycetaceae bacterium]